MTQPSRHKILLLGGSGFIGTALAAKLRADGHDIIIGDQTESAAYPALWVHADICDRDSLRAACAGCDVIYNLAAVHRDDVRPLSLYDRVNVEGAENLCAVAEELGINHIIFTSSVAIYGLQDGIPDEDTAPAPFNDYGRTKAAAEDVFKTWFAATPDRTLTMVRPTVVFGPGNRGNVYNLLRQIAGGAFVMIGNGTNKKSMAYVENVAGFLRYSLSFAPGLHIYNYADKPDMDMNTLVRTVRKILGKKDSVGLRLPYAIGWLAGLGFDLLARLSGKTFPISRVRIKKFCANTIFSADKMQASGYEPEKDLATALTETIRSEFSDKGQ